MRHGYPPASWTPEERPEYYHALEAASLEGTITLLTARAVTRTFDRYVRVMEETWEAERPLSRPGRDRGIER